MPLTGKINVLHEGNQQNDSNVRAPRNFSVFDMSYILANTYRFGELTPHFAMEVVPDDKIELQCSHSARTYSFKAPIMQDINFKKDYFAVPMEALLPFNWEKIYTNPNIGDDVPTDAYTAVEQFDFKVGEVFKDFFDTWQTTYGTYDFTDTTQSNYITTLNAALASLINALTFAEYFYSSGSLVNVLGHSMHDQIGFVDSNNDRLDVDQVIDRLYTLIKSTISDFTVATNSGDVLYVDCKDVYLGTKAWYVSLRRAIEIIRDEGGLGSINVTNYSAAVTLNDFTSLVPSYHYPANSASDPIDLARLWSYQMVCHHFYSNDSVDYIYSANLYRELVSHYIDNFLTNPVKTFQYNGIDLPYDWLSSHFFDLFYADYLNTGSITNISMYCSLIFSYRHSLRYVDYFTGSKTRPLAVGNTDVSVSGSQVSVIDITRNIQMQRFLNAVNRSGRKIANYVQSLFGVNQKQDYHDPIFLGHTKDALFGSEVSNTGSDQLTESNSVTSVMMSNSSRYAFSYESDRPAVIIGITYFDINRMYPRTTDRTFFHADRFDMFNPFMQFIGDQPVKFAELEDYYDASNPYTFGYQSRYAEYKQRVSRATGGFVKNLPGYAFVADDSYINRPTTVGPEFIRSSNCELDPYYVSLSGYSLGSYFHFIVFSSNSCKANRPMSYLPNIL